MSKNFPCTPTESSLGMEVGACMENGGDGECSVGLCAGGQGKWPTEGGGLLVVLEQAGQGLGLGLRPRGQSLPHSRTAFPS